MGLCGLGLRCFGFLVLCVLGGRSCSRFCWSACFLRVFGLFLGIWICWKFVGSTFGWFVIASCVWVFLVGLWCVLNCLLFSLLCVCVYCCFDLMLLVFVGW